MPPPPSRAGFGTTIAVPAGMFGLGLVLMFVAHFLAFIGPDTQLEGGWLPYWWSYLWLYPLATGVVTLSMPRQWPLVAVALCAPPVVYFLALGVFEGNWRASSAAWLGALVTLALSMLSGYLVSLWRRSRNGARHTSTGSG